MSSNFPVVGRATPPPPPNSPPPILLILSGVQEKPNNFSVKTDLFSATFLRDFSLSFQEFRLVNSVPQDEFCYSQVFTDIFFFLKFSVFKVSKRQPSGVPNSEFRQIWRMCVEPLSPNYSQNLLYLCPL